MNATEKEKIISLRKQGYGYGKISKLTGIPKSTISSYCLSSSKETRCLLCGGKIKNTIGHRQKIYCSAACRREYWKLNKGKIKRNPTLSFTCLCCHKKFKGYK